MYFFLLKLYKSYGYSLGAFGLLFVLSNGSRIENIKDNSGYFVASQTDKW